MSSTDALQTSATKLLLLALAFSVVVVAGKWWKKTHDSTLPPGPPGHWLFGNTIPKTYPQRTFYEWTKEYGPIFSLRRGRNLWIIIGEQQAAIDIMEKENASLVDRPHNISAGQIMSGGKRILLVGAGKRFQKLRKALQSQMNAKVVEAYEPVQAEAARNVLLDILAAPDDHIQHAKRYAASVIMTLTYGKTTPTSYSDPVVQHINSLLTRMGAAMRPGAYLVDSYPLLQYVPGYTTELKKFHQEELGLFRSQLDVVRNKMDRGEAQPCFAKYLLERQQEFDLSYDELAYLAGSMFGAGSDTTAAAIGVVIMAAALNPEAQRKVQEQLDLIVGKDRMPAFGDMQDLPEVAAYIQESYRWRTVSVGGFPHRATKDIYYRQYRIPEGAIVIANHWALARDESFFPNPEEFRPSRWLNEGGQMDDNLKYFNFGFGRRVCPGQHVANRSLFINTASILWAFNISQDPAHPIDTLAFTDTANTHPLPFKVKFEPRIPHLKEIVEHK